MADTLASPITFPEELLNRIRSADRIVVLTGAGISAESGIPTFREAQTGLWAKYRPEDLATPQAFQKDPVRVWLWYAWRRSLIARAEPNKGHLALARMEKRFTHFHVITQNVDGLHSRAGSQNIIEFHGNIFRTKCSYENLVVEATLDDSEIPPRCPACKHYLRPDVVWFGEPIPVKEITNAFSLVNNCQVFFSIGTSGLVEPAASLPILAHQQGSLLVEVNLDRTPLTNLADYSFRCPAGLILPELINSL